MPSRALTAMQASLMYVDQLEAIHKRIQKGRGRRHQQDALHRAAIVLSVASWESYVEQVLVEAFEAVKPAAGSPLPSILVHEVARIGAAKATADLNTPNAENVRRIFKTHLGYDSQAAWSLPAPAKPRNGAAVAVRLNGWLKVRHSIAHGVDLPKEAVIKVAPNRHALQLRHLKECRNFVMRIAGQTDTSLSQHLASCFGIGKPW